MNTDANTIRKELKSYADPVKVAVLQRFFKTGKDEYAEGDIFLGITVPQIRSLAKKHRFIEIEAVQNLLKSQFHEERLLALLILVLNFRKTDPAGKKEIYSFYLNHTKYINNWDLVDLSAKQIVGEYLSDKDRTPLCTLAKSKSLWERRIAIISTFYFIGKNDYADALKISKILLSDKHDLIHKAVGWMLREVGKRNIGAEKAFLNKYYKKMPRTMLRYAIEKFPEPERQLYLKGEVNAPV